MPNRAPREMTEREHRAGAFPQEALFLLPDSILFVTAEGRILAYHRGRGRRVDGFAPFDNVVGTALADHLPDSAVQILRKAIARALHSQQLTSCLYALSSEESGRERRYYEVRISPADAKTVLCVIRDVTAQRLHEQDLIRRELYFAALTQIYHRLFTVRGFDEPYVEDALAALGYASGSALACVVDLNPSDGELLSARGVTAWSAQTANWKGGARHVAIDLVQSFSPHWVAILRSGEPVQVTIADLAEECPVPSDLLQHTKALLFVPILEAGLLVGLLGFVHDVDDKHWTAEEISLLRAAAAALSFYKERARMYGLLREGEQAIRGLYEVAARHATLEEKLTQLLTLGTRRFRMESGAFVRLEGDKSTLVAGVGLDNQAEEVRLAQERFWRATFVPDGPVVIGDVVRSSWARLGEAAHLRAYVAAPVLVAGEVYGLLCFSDSSPRVRDLQPGELEFLRLMAEWVGHETGRVQYEEQLQANAEEIARMNVALAEARDRAHASDRAKSEFLAVMGHEIRTPLNSVISMSEMLLTTPLSAEQREYVDLVYVAGLRLLKRINAILDFVALETGKLKLGDVAFSPANVVHRVADSIREQALSKHLSLMTFVHPDVPGLVRGDPERLYQVLWELVDNAVKFTEQGEVVVRVEPLADASVAADDPVRVRFSVSDTGIGLPPDADEWLFQPFRQADSSTTREYGGTGLGLAIAQRLVGLMGGTIGVRSSRDMGATFWFTVSLGRSGEMASAEPRRENLDGLRVLVLDDLDSNREIMGSYLERWGATCDLASDSQAALALLEQAKVHHRPYHLVLVDLMLPVMDGFAFAKVARQRDVVGMTRLVLVTAYDTPGQGEKARREGFSAYLTKPFSSEQLYDVLVHTMAAVEEPVTGMGGKSADRGARGDRSEVAVLLVERNVIVRRIAAQEFERLGGSVLLASEGKGALRLLATSPAIDLALLDLQLPEERVTEVVRVIRRQAAARGRPVVVVGVSSQTGEAVREACLRLGLDAYEAKPLTPSVIERLFSAAMQTVKS